MRLITVAGPPSSGKTAVILRTGEQLRSEGWKVGVVKFDCLTTTDHLAYEQKGFPVLKGLAGNLCPDHFFVCNIDDCVDWGRHRQLDLLISESAGLCNRCSPHIKGVLAVCVIDNLAGVDTPQKIGPMLKLADRIVITKGDVVSQAEREIFAFRVKQANPRADLFWVNGITGQGAFDVSQSFKRAAPVDGLEGWRIRFPMPAAVCPYCVGETEIGRDHQRGNVKKLIWEETPR